MHLSTAYYVNIDAGAFQDPSGNAYAGISDTTTWAFTTAASNPFTISILDEETDIVNTGGALVSAVHFQAPGIQTRLSSTASHARWAPEVIRISPINFTFEGDFRNGGSGLPQDGSNIIQVLLSGIAGANRIIMSVTGLTAGRNTCFRPTGRRT